MIIVCISDTHNKYKDISIPKCDILISTGDYSFCGNENEVRSFHEWMDKQDVKYKISIQGNHELWVEKNFEEAKSIAKKVCPDVYFIDEGLVKVENKKIWCSSVTPTFYNWAWNKNRGSDIRI